MRVLLLLSALLAGCSFGDTDEPAVALAEARGRWSAAGVQDYRFTLTRSCECLPEWAGPLAVEVRADTVAAVTYAGGPAPFLEAALTVEGLFDLVSEAVAERAEQLHVEYDAAYGFPAVVSVDYDFDIADDEIVYYARDFEPLP